MSHEPQPQLSDLLGRYLQQQAIAHASGMAFPDTIGEVVPHDAAPAPPVDPRMAWGESLAALRLLNETPLSRSLDAPPEWSTLVVSHEPETALAFAACNFPQLVRNLQPLWQTDDLTTLRPRSGDPAPALALLEWTTETLRNRLFPQALLAIGALRLSRQYDSAGHMLQKHEADVPGAWRTAWANEQAALAWHSGQAEAAANQWQAQKASVPVLFNRGMAALFLGRAADARTALGKAVAELPEDGAWHHLGRLYLALAEMR